MRIEDNGVYRDATQEEIAAIEAIPFSERPVLDPIEELLDRISELEDRVNALESKE